MSANITVTCRRSASPGPDFSGVDDFSAEESDAAEAFVERCSLVGGGNWRPPSMRAAIAFNSRRRLPSDRPSCSRSRR